MTLSYHSHTDVSGLKSKLKSSYMQSLYFNNVDSAWQVVTLYINGVSLTEASGLVYLCFKTWIISLSNLPERGIAKPNRPQTSAQTALCILAFHNVSLSCNNIGCGDLHTGKGQNNNNSCNPIRCDSCSVSKAVNLNQLGAGLPSAVWCLPRTQEKKCLAHFTLTAKQALSSLYFQEKRGRGELGWRQCLKHHSFESSDC